MESIDIYCERLGPGLLAEPVNALTNGAFFIAAYFAFRLAKERDKHSRAPWILLTLISLIGVASVAFHTMATRLTGLLDTASIAIFLSGYLWVYCRQVMRASVPVCCLHIAILLAALVGGMQIDSVLNGSMMYAPALVYVVALGVYHRLNRQTARNGLLLTSGIFIISLSFRTMDNAVCTSFPLGTHFLWHCLNAVAMYLAMRTLILSLPRPAEKSA